MSIRRTLRFALASAVATCVLGLSLAPAVAAPPSAQTSADRARVERAVIRLQVARDRAARLSTRVRQTSDDLDRLVAEQEQTRARLSSRARMMYRTGDTSLLSVLLGAATYQEFASRWELLTRMSRQDAEDLRTLAIARAKAERSARSLLTLQEEQARSVDAVAREVALARKQLASSKAALAEYQRRTAPVRKRTVASTPKRDSKQRLRGTGAWKTGVASHYGRNFTGRGASGKRIGPYSMMVAHKTLPFGTLIEFEYNGKRAVASVEDRGPRSASRDFDLGPGVVRVLDFNGVHKVKYRIIKR